MAGKFGICHSSLLHLRDTPTTHHLFEALLVTLLNSNISRNRNVSHAADQDDVRIQYPVHHASLVISTLTVAHSSGSSFFDGCPVAICYDSLDRGAKCTLSYMAIRVILVMLTLSMGWAGLGQVWPI